MKPLTRRQLKAKYTRRLDFSDRMSKAFIQVGCQSFTIVESTAKQRAEWFRNMAAIAIENLIKENQHQL